MVVLPSCASVERVFSVAVNIITKKLGKTSNETFESQLFLKILKGCRLVSDGRSCPRCKCDLGYYRRPAHVDEFVCPPIKSCPKEYGCEIRQRIGKCPFCKCYFKKHRRNVPF
ncbi:hypothetical protein HPB47_001669 [Ixodes persulcatus]|uniref:Uncharacterized protein n=1 Tax=Ixodes persulcatus TaxID=34615 RepID=A0AC60PNJ8_IXOPE|nr:hypothetical protein HPB47_001669 [Ixodes persulcatus]